MSGNRDKPILILQHEEEDPPATIAAYLNELGLLFEVRLLHEGDSVPRHPEEFAAVVTMGGDMHVHEGHKYPFLVRERLFLKEVLAAGTPQLAICLGAQQLAQAAGGRVYRRRTPEVGWVAVDVIAEDPLFAGVGSPFMAMEWHEYSFTLPPGATPIASRPDGLQAFRLGAAGWAVQFHPEVDRAMVEHWARDGAEKLADIGGVARLSAETEEHIEGFEALCRRLVANLARAAGIDV